MNLSLKKPQNSIKDTTKVKNTKNSKVNLHTLCKIFVPLHTNHNHIVLYYFSIKLLTHFISKYLLNIYF